MSEEVYVRQEKQDILIRCLEKVTNGVKLRLLQYITSLRSYADFGNNGVYGDTPKGGFIFGDR